MSIDYSLFAFPKPKNKAKKSKRTKAVDIDIKIKKIVWERDGYKCIFCGKVVPLSCANAHFIKRSQGGLGIEENVFTACVNCHNEQDNGKNTEVYTQKARKYLKQKYGKKWKEENLVYKKQQG